MFEFNKEKYREKLYKIVYESESGGWRRECSRTLLVPARNPIRAVKKFYELVGNTKDINITEFTEIKYGTERVEANCE